MQLARLTLSVLFLAAASAARAEAQVPFGEACAGISGTTPTLSVTGTVKAGETFTLTATTPGGLGLAYLVIGLSNTSWFGYTFPVGLAYWFSDPLWNPCWLNIAPNYGLVAYQYDPNVDGGRVDFTVPGWSYGTVYFQVVNIDGDFATRYAGASRGLAVRGTPPAEMVAIPPGTFSMGSNAPEGTPYYGPVGPVHDVTISYPFWIGKYEVTEAEYNALLVTGPTGQAGGGRPKRASWNTARTYCAALNAAETLAGNVPAGYEYRLPTEAEWEYACRAGTTSEYHVGDVLDCADAQFEASEHTGADCPLVSSTVVVGSFAPNTWGLHDMHGNVWEWCLDSYAPYPTGPVTDPFVTGGALRVQRGGGFESFSYFCRTAFRYYGDPGSTKNHFGFRVVLGPILVP
jgi:formylglycine-generating enzyme required for sulfatase activity